MKRFQWLVVGLILIAVGCGTSESSSTRQTISAERYVLKTEPAGAVPVGEARQTVESDEEVTLVGLIGGSSKPFVDGVAAFTIVDASVPYCADEEGCPTPWDYCCKQNQVKNNIATVKVVDDSGVPIEADAMQLLGVKELSQVVVQGKAIRDDAGNLTVAATKVFVRPGS
ncbi:MAG: hypothetical protein AAF802_20060 [Planctomycetota bacterium]